MGERVVHVARVRKRRRQRGVEGGRVDLRLGEGAAEDERAQLLDLRRQPPPLVEQVEEVVVEAKDMLWQIAVDLVSRLPETFKFILIKKARRLLSAFFN